MSVSFRDTFQSLEKELQPLDTWKRFVIRQPFLKMISPFMQWPKKSIIWPAVH